MVRRRSQVPGRELPCSWERGIERGISRIRAEVEHPFHVVKDLFGSRKTRYCGLTKKRNLPLAAFALADLALPLLGGQADTGGVTPRTGPSPARPKGLPRPARPSAGPDPEKPPRVL